MADENAVVGPGRSEKEARAEERMRPAREAATRALLQLVACGAVGQSQLGQRPVRFQLKTSRNVVVMVRVADISFAYKEWVVESESGHSSTMDRELAVYRGSNSSSSLAVLRPFLPRLLNSAADMSCLVLEVVSPEGTCANTPLSAWNESTIDGAASLLACLVDVQRTDCDVFSDLDVSPWVLWLWDDVRMEGIRPQNRIANEFLEMIRHDRFFENLAHRLMDHWSPSSFIHGDLRLTNLLTASDPTRLVAIDWELAGFGLPEWDWGSFLASLIMREANEEHGTDTAITIWGDVVSRYRSRCGRPLNDKLVEGLATLRIVQLVFEQLQMTGMRSPTLTKMLQTARGLPNFGISRATR